jgi:GNAT superfamily N-acetyltransferase
VQSVRLRDGTRVEVRPIDPGDAQALRAGFERLSLESRYERFLSPLDHLSDSTVRYLTDVDHHDHEALVAVEEGTARIIGVARYVREKDPAVAEAAITVADDWHGRGLGTALLDALAERAREEGVRKFTALVLARNEDMIDMLFRLGPAKIVSRAQGAVEIEAELPPAGTSNQLRGLLRMAAQMTRRRRVRREQGTEPP